MGASVVLSLTANPELARNYQARRFVFLSRNTDQREAKDNGNKRKNSVSFGDSRRARYHMAIIGGLMVPQEVWFANHTSYIRPPMSRRLGSSCQERKLVS